MLVCSCPQCGRPSPLSLATPLMRCTACGYQGRVPPAVEQSMQGATAILRSLDARGRQLDSKQVKALSSSGLRSFLLIIPVLIVTVPALLWAVLGAAMFLPKLDFAMFFFFALPLLVIGTAEFLALRSMRRSRRTLLEACAAIPPEATGGAAGCHLCGAPLQASTQQGVVRCAFCSADNVVDPRLLSQLGARTVKGIEQIEEQVKLEAARVGSATRAAGLAVVGAGCLGPVLMIVLLIVTIVITSYIEIDMIPEPTYAVVRTDAGDCVAMVTRPKDTYRISYGGGPELGYIPFEDRKSIDGLQLQSPAFLAGRRVRIHHLKKEGTVVKLFSNPMQYNKVRVKMDDGTQIDNVPQGLCLLDTRQP